MDDLANHGDQYALNALVECDTCGYEYAKEVLAQGQCQECVTRFHPKDYEVEVTLSPYSIGV